MDNDQLPNDPAKEPLDPGLPTIVAQMARFLKNAPKAFHPDELKHGKIFKRDRGWDSEKNGSAPSSSTGTIYFTPETLCSALGIEDSPKTRRYLLQLCLRLEDHAPLFGELFVVDVPKFLVFLDDLRKTKAKSKLGVQQASPTEFLEASSNRKAQQSRTWEQIRSCLINRRTNIKEQILQDFAYSDSEHIFFRSKMIKNVDRQIMRETVRAHGGLPIEVFLGGDVLKIWKLPELSLEIGVAKSKEQEEQEEEDW